MWSQTLTDLMVMCLAGALALCAWVVRRLQDRVADLEELAAGRCACGTDDPADDRCEGRSGGGGR